MLPSDQVKWVKQLFKKKIKNLSVGLAIKEILSRASVYVLWLKSC